MSSQPPEPFGDRLVIGFAGRIGAGKTSAGKFLHLRYGFQYLRYSLVLSDWLAKDLESKTDLQKVGWKVMSGGMQAELNRRLIANILPMGDAGVDGLRHPTDVESLKKSFASSFHLIYIESVREERWKRLKRHGSYADFGAFEAADSHPVEQQIESLRTNAEVVLNNDRSLEELYVALDEAVRGFRKGGNT